jgi:hypothetical protein
VRTQILALFEKHRATPGATFDAEHFLDYLLPNPSAKGAYRNSFRGLRRFNAFVDAVQLECAVCLSQDDREKNYSVDRFVARLEQLQRSPRGSLASLRNQMRGGRNVTFAVIANLILLLALTALRTNPWMVAALAALLVAFNSWYVLFHVRSRRYRETLRQKIFTAHGMEDHENKSLEGA